MIERIAGFISRHHMFAAGGRVGVAVSGGADSVCLLHVLCELRARWDLHLLVIHINHLLRGDDSDGDEQFTRGLAQSLDVPFVCERIDVAARAEAQGDNLEQAARQARLDVFKREIASGRVDRVAVAHTRSDQAETVLFRFLRGAYTAGLAGMRPVSPTGIVRPLLEVDRAEVERYLRDRGLSWREDCTNQDTRFSRNRIRHYWLPALAAEWNRNLSAQLAQQALLAGEDESYWVTEVDRVAPGFLARVGRSVIVDISHFNEVAPALARRLIRRAIEMAKGDLREVDFRHVEEIYAIVRGAKGHARVQIPGLDVVRSFDRVRLAEFRAARRECDFAIPVEVPGVVELASGSGSLSLEIVERQRATGIVTEPSRDTLGMGLDWDRIQRAFRSNPAGGLLVLRNWRPGDAYRRAGDRQERKIKVLFHTARVPIWDRCDWPVLCVAGRVVWSRKFGPAADVAADASTKFVLRISEGK